MSGLRLGSIEPLIAARAGLPPLVSGIMNVRLPEPYFVKPDATISGVEYNGSELIYLQRCVLCGIRALIMRPHTHEIRVAPGQPYGGHGPEVVEIMAAISFRQQLGISLGDQVIVEAEGDEAWWSATPPAMPNPTRGQ